MELKSYAGMLTDVLRTVSEGGFSCREDTTVFAEFTANIKGLGASDVRLNALYDGVKQTVHTIDRTEENGSLTVHFSVSVTASAGMHTVSAEACGNADIQRITGIVWGQGIVGEQAVPTNSEDYEFEVSGNRATITRYIGSSKKPSIPSVLDGADVKVIGDEAFYDLPVEFVYIPEGVEEIQDAFQYAEKLERVNIPESVKSIGAEAFRYTALKTVRIASDCEYSSTSFPEGCEVEFYGGGGDYGQLYDRDGYAILDCEAARIYVRSDIMSDEIRRLPDVSAKELNDAVKKIRRLEEQFQQMQSGTTNGIDACMYTSTADIEELSDTAMIPYSGWAYKQESGDGVKLTAVLTAKPGADCLLVAAIMHRAGGVTLNGDGWTKLVDSAGIKISNENQYITVFTKRVAAGSHTVTATLQKNAEASMKLFEIYNTSGLTVVENRLISEVPTTPIATTGKRRLYMLHSAYSQSTANPPMSMQLDQSNTKKGLLSAEQTRFSVFYDWYPDGETPVFTYFNTYFTSNYSGLLVLDIEEVQNGN